MQREYLEQITRQSIEPLDVARRANADSMIALFENPEAGNRDKRHIHAVLDNARYHLCQKYKRPEI